MGVRFKPARYQRPAWCTQLYPLWTDGFFARSEPRADRGDGAVRSRSISRRYIATCGKTANGRIPDLPASRQPNCRKLLPALEFDFGERAKELDTEGLESLHHDLQGLQLAPHFATWTKHLELRLCDNTMRACKLIFSLPLERPLRAADSVYVFSCGFRVQAHPQPLPRAREKSESAGDRVSRSQGYEWNWCSTYIRRCEQ